MRKKRVCFLFMVIFCVLCFVTGCGQDGSAAKDKKSLVQWKGLQYDHSMELDYAQNFSVDYYEGGYALITIVDGGQFLVVPEDKVPPENLESDITVLQQPISNIYLVASSAMDLFCSLDALNSIKFSGTTADNYYIQAAKEAIENGSIQYAGKYSAPDYELIVSGQCGLAIESTMIYHTPEVQEKLEEFGIPVLVERSSYESHPLGRMEWIKLYAVLLDKEELAETLIDEQTAKLKSVESKEEAEKTVAFFYISDSGYVNVRKSSDYISKMIQLAGGKYIFDNLEDDDTARSSVNMQMESFYATAKDADILIYNSTLGGELKDLDELFAKSPLLKDFKAVQTGEVWCTTKNMFQEIMSMGEMIVDFHRIIKSEETESLTYMYRLQ